jgi:hypothetical protein
LAKQLFLMGLETFYKNILQNGFSFGGASQVKQERTPFLSQHDSLWVEGGAPLQGIRCRKWKDEEGAIMFHC